MVIIDIKGESFLWMMVRFMIGALIKVVSGAWKPETVSDLLTNLPGSEKPAPVPPFPLILMENHYNGISFTKVPLPVNSVTNTLEYLVSDIEMSRNMYIDGSVK